jgi:lipopolysaccharide heptosyltransferase II
MAGGKHNRYNILYTTSFGNMMGGGQWSLYYLIKHLDKGIFHPIVVCPAEGELAERMRGVGAEVICLDVGRIRYLNPLIIKKFISLIRDKRIDLIHTDSPTETFYAGIAARMTGTPLIWHIRVSDGEWLLDRVLSSLATRLILVAHALSQRFPWLEDSQRIVVIYNGIDLEEFDNFPATSSIRTELNVSQDTVLLVCIGRIEERKGQEDLISAMRDIDNAKLILVGGGDKRYIRRIQNLCKEFGISDRVFFTGYRDDIPSVLRDIDIFVFPTIKGEGFPRVILEAMAAGKPVVATDNAGNPEAVVDGLTGYIVPAGGSSSLAAKLNELVANKKKRTAMGGAGRKRVEGFFPIQRNVEGTQNVYLDILEKHNERSIVAHGFDRMIIGLKSRMIGIYLGIRKILLWPLTALREVTMLPQHDIKSILFLRHDRIGDMVLSTAALKALKRAYPDAMITVLASKRNYEILKHNPHVDEIFIYKGVIRFIREIRSRDYDLVIDPFLTYELQQAFMTHLARGKYRIGFARAGREIFFNLKGPVASSPKKMVDHLLDLVEAVGGKREGCVPEVFLTDEEQQWASEVLSNKGIGEHELIVAIHTGAYYPSQRWPTERFGELARRILEQYEVKVILLGSRDEQDLVKKVKEIAGKGIKDFSGLRLRKLIALLSKCDLMVCNNSGPLHIASALKVPTVSMIGPTVTPLWLPSGKHDVLIKKELSCSPCNRAICKGHECMESITADEVFESVRTQIARIRSQSQKGHLQAKGRV